MKMGTFEFETSKGELFCLAAIQGFGSLLNIEYEPEETGTDLLAVFNKLTERLRNKGWLDEDFDGNMAVDSKMAAVISLCGSADRFWVVQSHVKRETTADYIYTLYNTGDDYLVLEQIDGEKYKGLLTSDIDAAANVVFTRTPFTEAPHTYKKIMPGEVEAITGQEPYALVSASKYTTATEGDERSLICLNAAMFLLLDNGGTYTLSVDKTDDGEFVPVDNAGFDRIFYDREGDWWLSSGMKTEPL